MLQKLTTTEHKRDVAGLKYIYPVLSRRAGGLSIGVNFNTNNACNWRCIYCQVPGLQRGSAPEIDLALLEKELRFFLQDVLQGDFFDRFQVASEQRVIKDIAISGNGEATSLKSFDKAVSLIGEIATQMGVLPESRYVLISNGSLVHQSIVQNGLRLLNTYHGEMWFKLDSATPDGRRLINDCRLSNQAVLENLQQASRLCRVKLQTCLFHYQERVWTAVEKQAYLVFLSEIKEQGLIDSIMLYSLARVSQQPEVKQLHAMPVEEMEDFAAQLRALGYSVSVSP